MSPSPWTVASGGDLRETWTRTFGETTFRSTLREGRGGWAGLVTERFGPVTVGLALVVGGGRLHVVVRRWALTGIPLPLRFAPQGDSFETETNGRFVFDVEIAQLLVGRIVRYRGWLARTDDAAAQDAPRNGRDTGRAKVSMPGCSTS